MNDTQTSRPGSTDYFGTKRVTAWPEDREGEPGYGVQYPDGYVSWSPKQPFEAAYRPVSSMDFSGALAALKMGQRVARHNWNGPHQFVERIPLGDRAGAMSRPFYAIRTTNGEFVPWAPSQTDLDAEDWSVLEG